MHSSTFAPPGSAGKARPSATALRLSDENILAEFESLYDPRTGAWHLPGLFVDGERYEPGVSARWRELKPHFGPVERAVGQLFGSLVMLYEPSVVLEAGTNLGYSGARIAHALHQLGGPRMLYTIDPVPCDQDQEKFWVCTAAPFSNDVSEDTDA
jgi:hypothetical protein